MAFRRLSRVALFATLLTATATDSRAADLHVRRITNFLLEFTGGSDTNPWHIQYGTRSRLSDVIILTLPGPTAYFSHDNWLRRIDVEKGVVTGRWLFPGDAISGLQWKDNQLQVQVKRGDFRPGVVQTRTFDFDPAAPSIPEGGDFPPGTSRTEGVRLSSRNRVQPSAEIKRLLPEIENTARRDPFSPWVQVELGRAYLALGRDEGKAKFIEAINLESAHFSELLGLSFYLMEVNQFEPAKAAFERGYSEFWKHGGDPRFQGTFPLRLMSYGLQPTTPKQVQNDFMNQAYLVSPWAAGSEEAWTIYGELQRADGNLKESNDWQTRAQEARARSLTLNGRDELRYAAPARLVATAFVFAAPLYLLVLFLRYRPQRQMRLAAERAAGVRRPGFCNVEYWSRGERVAFFSIVVIAWIAEGAGLTLQSNWVEARYHTYRIDTANLITYANIEFIQANVSQSPERDLLLATIYQRTGDTQKAESLYRALPGFAESWNNLGVILTKAGQTTEARQAFDHALQLNPGMPEARLNRDRKPSDTWTELNEKFVPDQPMIAILPAALLKNAFGMKNFRWIDAMRGPLAGDALPNGNNRTQIPLRSGVLVLSAVGSVLAFLFRPREVLKAPPKYSFLAELLLPGTARAWGKVGGIALGISVFISSQLWSQEPFGEYSYYWYSTGYRWFPLVFDDDRMRQIMAAANPLPSAWWLVVLYGVNAAVILLSRRQRPKAVPQ